MNKVIDKQKRTYLAILDEIRAFTWRSTGISFGGLMEIRTEVDNSDSRGCLKYQNLSAQANIWSGAKAPIAQAHWKQNFLIYLLLHKEGWSPCAFHKSVIDQTNSYINQVRVITLISTTVRWQRCLLNMTFPFKDSFSKDKDRLNEGIICSWDVKLYTWSFLSHCLGVFITASN